MVNVTQQIGGSLGLAILVTVYGTASRNAARGGRSLGTALDQARQAVVHGMASAFATATVFDACALLVIIVMIGNWQRTRRDDPPRPGRRDSSRLPAAR
jgi:hypothetical protein